MKFIVEFETKGHVIGIEVEAPNIYAAVGCAEMTDEYRTIVDYGYTVSVYGVHKSDGEWFR